MSNFVRIDGRSNYALRPISYKLNPLKTGPSCKIEVGNIKNEEGILKGIGGRTSVIAVLLFSNETKSKNPVGSFHKPYMEVFIRPQSGTIKSSIRSMEATLVKVMQSLVKPERLGKVTLSLRIQIMEDSGGLLAVCLNSLVLCLSLSGLEITQMPYAVSFGVVRPNCEEENQKGKELLILDPTDYEIRTYCSTSLTVLCNPETGDLSLINVDSGSGSYGNSMEMIKDIARNAAARCLSNLSKLKEESLKSYYVTLESNK